MACRLAQRLPKAPPTDTTDHLVVYNFGGAQHQEVFANAIARFNEVYPNVTVEDLYIPSTEGWGGFTTNILLRLRSGLQTDVIAIAIEGAHELVASGALLPLDDFIAAEPALQEVEADSHPALAAGLAGRDGNTYYITREWNNMIIHYNTNMFDAAGLGTPDPMWTWDDFLEAALTLTTGEGADKVFGYVIPFFFFGLQPWFHTNGTGVLNDDWTQSNLDDPKMLESVKFIHSLVHEHGVSPSVEGVDMLGLFTSERAAMTAFGRWTFANYIANDFRQVDVVHWPRKETGTTVFGSGGWAITKSAQNVPLALELVKEFLQHRKPMSIPSASAPSSRRGALPRLASNSCPSRRTPITSGRAWTTSSPCHRRPTSPKWRRSSCVTWATSWPTSPRRNKAWKPLISN